ncbi:MAG: flagellar protein export ATPase FliI [Deltaproteobacteria bacterium]|nr:flagellar protein export ATPase FliI [Deltaproteobacteria bacterium]
MDVAIDFNKYQQAVAGLMTYRIIGRVSKIIGLTVEGYGPGVSVGSACYIYPMDDGPPIKAEVVGFKENRIVLMPLGDLKGVAPSCRIVHSEEAATIPVGPAMLGRVLDGLGEPIDGLGPIVPETRYPIYAEPLNPLRRARIHQPMDVGVRAINSLLTLGKGQRMGIFAGSGVGKSTLMGMMARNTRADVNVIGLIGERGRELREFIEKDLGEEGLKRSVVVCATSDQAPLVRMRGAYIATTIAEYFRDRRQDVLLMMDSLTRFAMAQREVGLAVGEPPTTRGYTPTVFTLLPKLLERASVSEGGGSITGIYTVLVEGDDFNEPISDAARAILDGHIMLTREMAAKNHYPAIDVLSSVSRVMSDVVTPEQKQAAGRLLNILATYRRSEDLINIGAYVKGSNPAIDHAISMIDRINSFLIQAVNEKVTFDQCVNDLSALVG